MPQKYIYKKNNNNKKTVVVSSDATSILFSDFIKLLHKDIFNSPHDEYIWSAPLKLDNH